MLESSRVSDSWLANSSRRWPALLFDMLRPYRMIPLFQRVVYPSCRSMGLKCAPLTRMALGMVLCASAFIIAGVLQISIDEAAGVPVPPTGAALYRVRTSVPFGSRLAVAVFLVGALLHASPLTLQYVHDTLCCRP